MKLHIKELYKERKRWTVKKFFCKDKPFFVIYDQIYGVYFNNNTKSPTEAVKFNIEKEAQLVADQIPHVEIYAEIDLTNMSVW